MNSSSQQSAVSLHDPIPMPGFSAASGPGRSRADQESRGPTVDKPRRRQRHGDERGRPSPAPASSLRELQRSALLWSTCPQLSMVFGRMMHICALSEHVSPVERTRGSETGTRPRPPWRRQRATVRDRAVVGRGDPQERAPVVVRQEIDRAGRPGPRGSPESAARASVAHFAPLTVRRAYFMLSLTPAASGAKPTRGRRLTRIKTCARPHRGPRQPVLPATLQGSLTVAVFARQRASSRDLRSERRAAVVSSKSRRG